MGFAASGVDGEEIFLVERASGLVLPISIVVECCLTGDR
jgi:hypothetical protein